MSINPYESPLADCPPVAESDEHYVRYQMHTVVRLYWWMGVIGGGGYSVAAVVVALDWIRRGASADVESAARLVFCAMAISPFAASIYVARRLAARPQGMLPRARLVGIILATAWFPILTVPGLICVRRVTRYLEAYCNLLKTDRDRVADVVSPEGTIDNSPSGAEPPANA
jgi:hypothetical protein